jgi:CBS-domain-containing membrane protein
MSEKYSALSSTHLLPDTTYHRPPQILPEYVTTDSPAVDVMTDFTKVSALTMGPCASIEAANKRMIATGVRLLLVADQYNAVIGIITTTDLSGEKPMRYLQERGGKREDIFMSDIMTPQEQLDVLHMVDVEKARVGDIVETMIKSGRQHALVVDYDENKKQIVRGLFSTKQISKQLGITIETTEVARTFAELDAALG